MDTIHHEVWMKADNPRVFEAITTTEGLNSWWGPALRAEPKVGAMVEFDHGLGAPLTMRIVELVADRRVVWRCVSDYEDTGNPASEWLGHQLVFDLRTAGQDPESAWMARRLFDSDPGDEITILDFQHSGWSPDARWYAFCNSGWGVALDGLKSHCEA